jgi:hypothetical protein
LFTYAFDIIENATVFLFSGATNEADDYERYIVAFQALDQKSKGRDCPIAIVVVDPGNALPNAVWRRRIAEAAGTLRSKPLMILVSGSAMARGIVQAIQWVRPLPFDAETAADFDAAVRIAERRRGRQMSALYTLQTDARAAAAARARAHARSA